MQNNSILCKNTNISRFFKEQSKDKAKTKQRQSKDKAKTKQKIKQKKQIYKIK